MAKNKKTIVFFNGFYLPHLGGVERYTYHLAKELKKYYNIIIVTTNPDNSKSEEVLDGLTIYRIPIFKIFKNRYPLLKKGKEYKKIMHKLDSIIIDHIICNTRYYMTTLLGVAYAKNKNIDLSIIDHSSCHVSLSNKIIDFFANKYEDYLTKRIMKVNPRFYGVSERVNEWLKYYGIKASGVFYNSIEKEYVEKKKIGKNIIISYVGRIIKEKGVENLALAYDKLKNKYSISLTIAGDGSYLEYMKNNYTDISYPGNLKHNEVMKLLKKSDIFIHPSMYPEGLPTSILEAGMMKCAILATDRGGTKEVISKSDEGIIIEENIDDLTNKLELLLNDKELICKLQNGVYKKVCDYFTWDKTSEAVRKELMKYE